MSDTLVDAAVEGVGLLATLMRHDAAILAVVTGIGIIAWELWKGRKQHG